MKDTLLRKLNVIVALTILLSATGTIALAQFPNLPRPPAFRPPNLPLPPGIPGSLNDLRDRIGDGSQGPVGWIPENRVGFYGGASDPIVSPYLLRNAHTKKLLDLAIFQGNPNGAVVHGWDFNGQANQKWFLEPAGNGAYRIRNAMLGKYLDLAIVQNNPDGAPVHGWELNGQPNQRWTLERTPRGTYRLRNVMLGKLLDMAIFQGNPNGAKAHGFQDNGQLNQEWEFFTR